MHIIPYALGAAAEKSFLAQLWSDFIESFVTNEVYYPYLGLEGGSSLFSVKLMILGLFVGLSLASFGALYDKRVLGETVRAILRKEAYTPETAVTLSEIGYERNSIVRHSVRKSVTLRRVVHCVEEEKFLAEQELRRAEHEEKRKTDKSLGRFRELAYTFDLETDHFYIPEEIRYTADVKFEKKGSSWIGAIVFTLVMLVGYVVLLVYLPDILEILNDFAANFSPTGPKNMI